MAETKSSTSNPSGAEPEPEPEGEAEAFDSVRTTKPGIKRLLLTLSVVLSFFLGSPFLLKSVEIYRSPLPFRDIDLLSKQIAAAPLLFRCHFQAVFLGFEASDNRLADSLGFAIRDQIKSLLSASFPTGPACGSCGENFTLSVTVDSGSSHCVRSPNQNGPSSCLWQCGAAGAAAAVAFDGIDDEGTDELLGEMLGGNLKACGFGKVYSVVVVNRETGGDGEIRAVVGKHRHAWMLGRIPEAEKMVFRVAETFVKVFVNGGREEGEAHGEFMPVGADGKLVLSFSLLNAEPNDWIYDWDFQRVEKSLLTSILEALGNVADISVESQVLYHTPKASGSYWDDKRNSYILSTEELPFFVNSNEWHLDTSMAASGHSKILQIVVYVPSSNECPLLLQLPDAEISSTNSFISPMWGGVIVWNPPGCLRDLKRESHARLVISHQEIEQLFEVFMGQLRQLFGFKSENVFIDASDTLILLASERGFTEWELDALSGHLTCFNLISCSTTLGSLSRLVQSLPRMIIMDEIGKQVKFSLAAAKLAKTNASFGLYDASAASSRQARSLAEDAFFHPSIMSVSYYSFEHCFAVYSPFFLPVLLHVLLAALREWRRYKLEKSKYLAWKSKANVTSESQSQLKWNDCLTFVQNSGK